DCSYRTRLQKVSDHVVGDKREWDAAFVEFPCSQARSLKVRARFWTKNVQLFALLDRDAKDAERCADARRCERAGVALGHHAAFAWHEFGAKPPHSFIRRFLLQMNLLRFSDHCCANFLQIGSLDSESCELCLHPIDRPEKVDGRRPRLR